jgi:hypothetical protein
MTSPRHRLAVAVGAIASMLAISTSPALAVTTAATAGSSPQRAIEVQLQSVENGGNTRTYIASVLDDQGSAIANVDLDLGGLSADPDLRIPTIQMTASDPPTAYQANVTIPADGDWVIVVRVHTPTQLVQLFTDHIEGTGTAAAHHGGALDASRRAVLAADPTFFQRYNPAVGNGSLPAATAEAATTPVLVSTSHHDGRGTDEVGSLGLDAVGVVAMLVHSIGALAWMIAILGLVVANRVGPGLGRNELFDLIARRYRLLAGGGLLVVAVTGAINVQKSSAGLTHPSELVQTNIGMAYLALFGFKMALYGASLMTTYRIDRILQEPSRLSCTPTGSIMTMVGVNRAKAFRLAETNALLGGAILVSVALLGQLHHVLH